jgi:hypothetical protein
VASCPDPASVNAELGSHVGDDQLGKSNIINGIEVWV